MRARSLTLALLATVLASPVLSAPAKVFEGPLADDGRLTLNHGAQYADGAVTVTTTAEEEWHEYLVTVPEKVRLAANGVYRISYEYEVTKALTGAEPYLYHLCRASEAGDNDRGWETFTPKLGDKGKQKFVVSLANQKDYRLIIGLRFAGGVKLGKLTIEDLTPGPGVVFAPYFVPNDERLALNNDAAVANDAVSVDTTPDAEEWHEYLHTVPEKVALKSSGKYKISYDFTVTKPLGGGEAAFYHLVRTPDGNEKDQGMDLWIANNGEQGHKEFVVELERAEGYYLILGVRYKGGIKIENLRIEDLAVKK